MLKSGNIKDHLYTNHMTDIYLIRHGETTWNKQGRLQGHLDSPLTEKGKNDALHLLNYFQDINLDAIYSSDLGRALTSVSPLAQIKQLTITRKVELRELSYDHLDGKPKQSLSSTDKKQLATLFSAQLGYRIGQGESLQTLQKRLSRCLHGIALAHPGQKVAVMSHGLAIVMFLKEILYIPVDAPRTMDIHNGSVTHLTFDGQNWMLQSLYHSK
ncbi:histidine phosphatase family protein [Psychromonas ossibalaenae]|uniref:histidine phosphatase family protein n=1 Tax=Psychromonas ossibalaenae TaxID=444922 RepID=UPI0003621966|nr:histidine phosphatase family protein [Psychromonas ossibalaenae]